MKTSLPNVVVPGSLASASRLSLNMSSMLASSAAGEAFGPALAAA